ncbi:lysine--tRNA ligase [Pelagibacteraceae bacterium]|nr:lysine--tRNA ligase [Pelagibacteraceae bacterium]
MINPDLVSNLKSWPFKEALQIIKKNGGLQNFKIPKKGYLLFQTGYGPSGLPHIGTFGEVVRTSMVRNALESIIDCSTKLFTFSDDMDGLRKVPENVPKKEMLSKYLGKPLTSIPDPFDKFESFGHHNNAKLRSFLDEFNFEYEFVSSTEKYKKGDFNEIILKIFDNYSKILDIILPTLRSERKETYSPFLPISENTGDVLQVKIEEYKMESKTIVFKDPSLDKLVETEVINGKCKLQWKVDWAMRWMAFGVDYEMCGKDLTESVELGSKICKALDKKSPTNLIYEMFLDEKGEKISKSVGNGISVDEWLRYASPESLSLYMFQKPKSAKKLHFDIIPKTVDDYLSHYNNYSNLDDNKKFDNPIWHIHSGNPKNFKTEINFNTLTNLVSVSNSKDKKVIWSFINKYDKNINAENNPEFDRLIDYSLNYYNDFILPNKKYIKIDSNNKEIFIDIIKLLENDINIYSSAEEIQTQLYEIGKKYKFENLKDFFKLVYQVILGQDQGPRLGSFIKLFGVRETIDYIKKMVDN